MRYLKWLFFVSLVGIFTLFSAVGAQDGSCYLFFNCAPDKAFHKVICDTDGICRSEDGNSAIEPKTMYVENHGWAAFDYKQNPKEQREITFEKAWIEYDDFGKSRSPFYLKAILSKISELKEKNIPVYIVTFAHGWHHDADVIRKIYESDGEFRTRNSIKFDYFVARQAEHLRRLYEQRGVESNHVVIGIYIGWRGDSLLSDKLGLFRDSLKKLTIGNRAEVADTIGNSREDRSVYTDLKAIAEAAGATNAKSRMLVVGHSLGGRMMSRMFLKEIAQGRNFPFGEHVLGVALQPAIGANCFDSVLGINSKGNLGNPSFVAITSKDDDALSKIYPYAWLLIPDCSSQATPSGVTIGNHEAYLTHNLTFKYEGSYKGNVSLWSNPDWKFKLTSPDNSPAFPPAGSNKNWFQVLGNRTYAYTMYDLNCFRVKLEKCFDARSVDLYTMNFGKEDAYNRAGPIWNLRTDRSTIDIINKSSDQNPTHNGFVSTNLARALVEMQYQD